MQALVEGTRDEATALVVGAGAVGLAAAVGLARCRRPVILLGRVALPRPGRTVAIFEGGVTLLRELGVWPLLADHAAPLKAMRIVDATASLFRPPPVVFPAAEIGLPQFGYNLPNEILEAALRSVAEATPGLRIVPETVVEATFSPAIAEVTLAGGRRLRGGLVIAADGRRSRVRQAARIGTRETAHRQHALTAVLAHTIPHRGVSTEFHTRQGPFTLVPLPDAADAMPRSSLVWVMSPAEAERRAPLAPERLAAEIEDQCGRLLGSLSLASPVGRFPIVTSLATRLVGERVVLIGEAAHALPPIGAQGLNLSLRDVAALVAHLGRTPALGDARVLQRYARARAGDVATQAAGVGLLNGSLLAHGTGVDLLRGAGLTALSRSGRLRRFAMRRGLTPAAPTAWSP